MIRRIMFLAVVLSVALLAGSLSARAEGEGSRMVAQVAFEFTAGDTLFPAGSYSIVRRSADARSLVIRPAQGGDHAMLVVFSRIARQSKAPNETDANLVFVNVGNDRVLSEVWMPGQDGFLVRTALSDAHANEIR